MKGRRGWYHWRAPQRWMPLFALEQAADLAYLAEPPILRTATPPHVSSAVVACQESLPDYSPSGDNRVARLGSLYGR